MKKKTKKKIIKGTLYTIASFLFIFLSYYDSTIDKNNISLISYRENTIFTNVNKKELLNILNKKTGVILLVNNKKDINRYVGLLYEEKTKENIYVYNIKDEETILENVNDEVVLKRKPSKFYNELIDTLGAYAEDYYLLNENGEYIKTEYKKIYTPMVIFVKEGKILFSHYIFDENIKDEELADIYIKGYEILSSKL